MEELFDILIGIFFIVAAIAAKTGKKNGKKTVNVSKAASKVMRDVQYQKEELKAEAPVRTATPMTRMQTEKPRPVEKIESHFHEGRQDVPCPATEVRPMDRAKEHTVPAVPGLKMAFDRNTVLRGFVMSEILNRPRPGMRR